jgi:hypothetical protein
MIRSALRACTLLAACLSTALAGETGVAARVNGVAIEAERLQRYFEDMLAERGRSPAAIRSPSAYAALHREALEKLIEAELLWQEARRRNLLASKAEVERALGQARAGFAAPGAFERRLERGGFTAQSYERYLHQQLSIRKLVQEEVVARVSVSEAEVHAFYQANPERFARAAQAGGGRVPEAEVRGAIRQSLLAEKAQEALARKVQRLREASTVEIVGPR